MASISPESLIFKRKAIAKRWPIQVQKIEMTVQTISLTRVKAALAFVSKELALGLRRPSDWRVYAEALSKGPFPQSGAIDDSFSATSKQGGTPSITTIDGEVAEKKEDFKGGKKTEFKSEFGDLSMAVPRREGCSGVYEQQNSSTHRHGSNDHKKYQSKGFKC
ncbi:hypothetical protein [Rhodoferax antarcticus]|uniref:hypothetical protein n=1 Tax=Rhodoferax antarcticus TaxID=81479 RepID=UPI001115174B|nr:hypothetical protein [Rhodoferax antarcticus]